MLEATGIRPDNERSSTAKSDIWYVTYFESPPRPSLSTPPLRRGCGRTWEVGRKNCEGWAVCLDICGSWEGEWWEVEGCPKK